MCVGMCVYIYIYTHTSCHLYIHVCVCIYIYIGFPCGSDSKESACNAGDPCLIPGMGRSPGERNGNPLQYSCLENSMDRGVWLATVHGVAKSWTWLSNYAYFYIYIYTHTHTHTHIDDKAYIANWILHIKTRRLSYKLLFWSSSSKAYVFPLWQFL